MDDATRQVTIHLARLGKPVRSFTEGFVDDDGIRLRTFSIVPPSVGGRLSEKFRGQGWLLPGQRIESVAKYHFYREFFGIVAYQDRDHNVLGYYCDILTPLHRDGDEYFLTDLILDLWISPDLQVTELDRDEFDAAIAGGVFPLIYEEAALAALARLKAEAAEGIFPSRYVT